MSITNSSQPSEPSSNEHLTRGDIKDNTVTFGGEKRSGWEANAQLKKSARNEKFDALRNLQQQSTKLQTKLQEDSLKLKSLKGSKVEHFFKEKPQEQRELERELTTCIASEKTLKATIEKVEKQVDQQVSQREKTISKLVTNIQESCSEITHMIESNESKPVQTAPKTIVEHVKNAAISTLKTIFTPPQWQKPSIAELNEVALAQKLAAGQLSENDIHNLPQENLDKLIQYQLALTSKLARINQKRSENKREDTKKASSKELRQKLEEVVKTKDKLSQKLKEIINPSTESQEKQYQEEMSQVIQELEELGREMRKNGPSYTLTKTSFDQKSSYDALKGNVYEVLTQIRSGIINEVLTTLAPNEAASKKERLKIALEKELGVPSVSKLPPITIDATMLRYFKACRDIWYQPQAIIDKLQTLFEKPEMRKALEENHLKKMASNWGDGNADINERQKLYLEKTLYDKESGSIQDQVLYELLKEYTILQ
ncbi:MAG: hypothetical protein JWO53_994 [Chlamydiia bacterium]|nr:hypothetical protein [Chlamydiia bacterium]